MRIKNESWEVFKIYLEQAIDYFEGYADMDFEQTTLRDQLRSILWYDIDDDDEDSNSHA